MVYRGPFNTTGFHLYIYIFIHTRVLNLTKSKQPPRKHTPTQQHATTPPPTMSPDAISQQHSLPKSRYCWRRSISPTSTIVSRLLSLLSSRA